MHFGCVELVEQHGSTCSPRRARHVERVVSCRDVTWRAKWNMGLYTYASHVEHAGASKEDILTLHNRGYTTPSFVLGADCRRPCLFRPAFIIRILIIFPVSSKLSIARSYFTFVGRFRVRLWRFRVSRAYCVSPRFVILLNFWHVCQSSV